MIDFNRQMSLFVRDARERHLTHDDLARQLKREFILQLLIKHRFNQCRAAKAGGWHRNTLHRHIVELRIDLAAEYALAFPGKKRPERYRSPWFAAKAEERGSNAAS